MVTCFLGFIRKPKLSMASVQAEVFVVTCVTQSLVPPLSRPCAGAAGVSPGGLAATDAYTRSYKAVQSADFFCGIVPGSVLSQLGKAMNLEGAAGLAMKRLAREGLSWVPTAGNLCTLLAFGLALYINGYLTSESRVTGVAQCQLPVWRWMAACAGMPAACMGWFAGLG